MSVKSELRAFYAKQGLTGQHLRKAIQWDMKQVAKEVQHKRLSWAGPSWQPTSLMDCGWSRMARPLGASPHYWAHRYMGG